jgi:hypothetical protein
LTCDGFACSVTEQAVIKSSKPAATNALIIFSLRKNKLDRFSTGDLITQQLPAMALGTPGGQFCRGL